MQATPEAIDLLYRRMGYLRTPYHYVINRDGWTVKGRPESWPGGIDEPGVENAICVGVIVIKSTMKAKPEQIAQTTAFVSHLQKQLGLPPEAIVHRNIRITSRKLEGGGPTEGAKE